MNNNNKTIDSNVTSLFIAEEESLKVLPDDPIWHGIEVNSYSDIGGSTTLLQRETINPSRQIKKGKVVDLEANAGFSLDMTKKIFPWLMQGFMFANAREKFSSQPLNENKLAISEVTNDGYTFATSLPKKLPTGTLIYASGFKNYVNNGLKNVTRIDANNIIVSNTLVAESAIPSSAKITMVGFKFAVNEIIFSVNAGQLPQLVLNTEKVNFTNLGLIPGEWIWLGGDSENSSFDTNKGWARIASVDDKVLTFDDTDFIPTTENSSTVALEIYFGTVIKNENRQDLILKKSYCIERTLGNDETGIQAQYVHGAVANELTINLATAQFVTADLGYVACNSSTKKGQDRLIGERLPLDNTDAFNTTSNIYRQKLSIIDETSSTPSALFAYVTDSSLSIANGVTGIKAIGILGSVDLSVGNFNVTGSLTAYFSKVNAIEAIKNNADVGFSTILASENTGMIFDIPLLSLSGGIPAVEKDQKITIPLEKTGAENKHGYTMMYQTFDYLPDVAMPIINN